MSLSWLELSNPVAMWWFFLASVSVVNILTWIFSCIYLSKKSEAAFSRHTKVLLALSAAYVFVCAFRSFLPRADVQRICLFDTWFSSVLLGRTLATFAELCFVAQWAIVLNRTAKLAGSVYVQKISYLIVPLILIAEGFSWYAVISTHYLGNSVEESLWAVTYSLITCCLILLAPKFKGIIKYSLIVAIAGCILYVTFMVKVDVPMYLGRWQLDSENGKKLLGLTEGLNDLNSRWTVSHDIKDWKTEIPWMSLYFSTAVWTSLLLCYVPNSKEKLTKYLK